MLVVLLLVPLVLAGGPARCVATWSGPVDGCAVRGDLKATATGPNPRVAERDARKQMEKVVDLTGAAMRARVPALTTADFDECRDKVAAAAYVNCFDEPSLAADALCFVDLPDPDCWTGEVLRIEDVGWRALAVGRDTMCAQVDARLVRLNYTDVAVRRAACQASCATRTTVRCPSG